jgi:pimeloyl-ACP methyl ester carboxylesterase
LLANLICLIAFGVVRDWSSFFWNLAALFPQLAALYYLFSIKRKRVHPDEKPVEVTIGARVGSAFCSIFKFFGLFIASVLTAGAISTAIAMSYPPPGTFHSVLFDGANQNGTLHIYCIGARTGQGTIFLVGSSAHGSVDYYGIQSFLNSLSGTDRRVCSVDRLGFAWSQDPFPRQFTNNEWFPRLLRQAGEPKPWHVVGFGGGGGVVTTMAKNHASDIGVATYVEVFPPGIEFQYEAVKRNLDATALATFRRFDLLGRNILAHIVLCLGIPWGLMSILVPMSLDPNYVPPSRWVEFRVQLWKNNFWLSQLQGIQAMQSGRDEDDPLIAMTPLPSTVSVLGVYCNVTTSCFSGNRNLTGQACTDQLERTLFYNARKMELFDRISTNRRLITDPTHDCGLDMYIRKPQNTASLILAGFAQFGV